jgi:alkylated DNA nucleotide flippase Atl1
METGYYHSPMGIIEIQASNEVITALHFCDTALLDIPFGKTVSYADIARRIGQPTAVRVVGATNGKNHLWLVVPCHRVID